MIVFISCTKKKADHPCSAKEMYWASQWFRGGYRYAETLAPSHIYILSAKYGLLKPTDNITPYEKTMVHGKKAEIKQWSAMVYHQMIAEGIDFNEEAIFLCGKNYRTYLIRLFQNTKAPVSHMGIGKQMEYFKKKVEGK